MPRFVLYFLIYLIFILGLASYPLYKYGDDKAWEAVFANLALFFFLTIISSWIMLKKSQGENMLRAFVLSKVIKLLVAIIFFVVFLTDFKGRELLFALTFFGAYLLCTGFEVYYLMSNLRRFSESPNDSQK